MMEVVVIGAGKIGATIASLLTSTNDYQVVLADRSPPQSAAVVRIGEFRGTGSQRNACFAGCLAAMSFLLFQTQLRNFSLAIQGKIQEQKVFAHFGAIG
jgi:predicted dinucleotide-binding enzyme